MSHFSSSCPANLLYLVVETVFHKDMRACFSSVLRNSLTCKRLIVVMTEVCLYLNIGFCLHCGNRIGQCQLSGTHLCLDGFILKIKETTKTDPLEYPMTFYYYYSCKYFLNISAGGRVHGECRNGYKAASFEMENIEHFLEPRTGLVWSSYCGCVEIIFLLILLERTSC